MSKYETLDRVILNKIGGHPATFSGDIFVRDVVDECQRIAKAEGTARYPSGIQPFRICDRRLQALRKAGKIRCTPRGWVRA